jgi:YhcH/YjgK/YiaL family protein
MVIDQLKNAAHYYNLGEGIAAALRYLQNTDATKVEPGRYVLDGDQLYAMVQQYDTKPKEQGFWEAHRKYIDVQYVAQGIEHMGFAHLNQLRPQPYDEEKDFLKLEGEGEFVLMRAGTFVILGPEDAHMPGMAVTGAQPVRKVVVKVRI